MASIAFSLIKKRTWPQSFGKQLYYQPVDDREALDALRQGIVEIVCDKMGIDVPNDISDFLNNFGDHVSIDNLNDVRLHYRTMGAQEWFRQPTTLLAVPNWPYSLVMN